VQVGYASLLANTIEVREVEVVRSAFEIGLAGVPGDAGATPPVGSGQGPGTPGGDRPDGTGGGVAEAGGQTGPPPGGAGGAPEPTTTHTAARKPRELQLGAVSIVDSHLAVVGPAGGAPLIALAGYSAEFSFDPDWTGPGKVAVGEVWVAGRPVAHGLNASVAVDGDTVTVSGLTGSAAGGGSLGGTIKTRPTRPGIPFEADFTLCGCDIAGLAALLGGDPPGLAGTASAELHLHGLATGPATWTGHAETAIPELAVGRTGEALVFAPAESNWQVASGRIHLTDLYAHSEDLAVRASGHVRMDGDAAFNFRVFLPAGSVAEARAWAAGLGAGGGLAFEPLAETGWAFTGAAVRGPWREAQVSLAGLENPLAARDLWEAARRRWLAGAAGSASGEGGE
jgi:hypothetical protein